MRCAVSALCLFLSLFAVIQYKAQTERAVCDRHKNFRNTLTNIADSSRTEARHTYSNLKSVWVIFRSVSSFEHDPVLQLLERLQHENWCCVSMWWIHIDSASDVFVFLCDGSSSAEWRRSFVRTKCPSVPTTPLAASLSTAPGAAVHLQRWRTRAHILKPRALHTKKHITRSAGHRLMLPAQHICILHVMKMHHKKHKIMKSIDSHPSELILIVPIFCILDHIVSVTAIFVCMLVTNL